MKAILDKFADRVLSRLGLGLDFSVDLRESFFSEITGTLYLGARPNRERVQELKGAGVTHVVSCLMEDERSRMAFLQQDFHHLFLGVHDGMHEDIAGALSQFFEFAAAATASGPNAKLFVHCEVGVSRSATLLTALLMKTEGMSFFDALCRVRSKRIQVLPNIGFASQLQRLEQGRRGPETNRPFGSGRVVWPQNGPRKQNAHEECFQVRVIIGAGARFELTTFGL